MGSNEEDPKTTSCCDQLNICYQICDTTRLFCDSTFVKCLSGICAKSPEGAEKEACEADVSALVQEVALNDCSDFEKGQDHACMCVDETKFHMKRWGVVTNFLRTYDAKNLGTTHLLHKEEDTPEDLSLRQHSQALFIVIIMKCS